VVGSIKYIIDTFSLASACDNTVLSTIPWMLAVTTSSTPISSEFTCIYQIPRRDSARLCWHKRRTGRLRPIDPLTPVPVMPTSLFFSYRSADAVLSRE